MRARWVIGAAGAALLVAGVPAAARAQTADVPGDATTQTQLGADGVDGDISGGGDADWYRLRVERGQRYQFTLAAPTGEDGQGLDPTLAVYDAQGNQIAFNDDDGTSLSSALVYSPSESGEIFVEARGFLDESVGAYQLRFTASEAPADDTGNDASSRSRLVTGRTHTGAIEYEGDIDWFRLSVRTGQRYRIALDGGEGEGALRDPMLRLLDRDGGELASNDDSESGLNSLLDYVPSETGEVFVEASGFGGAQTGAYTLSVTAEALPTDNAAPGTNTRARLAPGQQTSSEIAFPSDSDWYRVRLAEGQTYRFGLSGAGDSPLPDPLLRIHDSGGEEIAMDDDGGDGLNSYLEFTASRAGNYYVEARSFNDDGVGGYTLSVNEGDIPGDATTDAGLSAVGDYREGALAPAGDRDWYRISLEEGQGLRIGLNSAEGADALGDPMLVVYGADGAELARDDDGGDGLNSWLEFQAPAAGAYFIEARGFADDAAGRYAITVVDGEIGADANNAEYLTPGPEGRTSLIGAAGDVDWYAISMVEGRPYRITLEGAEPDALSDPLLVIYDAEGHEVARDDDGGAGLSAYLTFLPTAGGVYYAAASAFGEDAATGRYLMRVTDSDVPGAGETDESLDPVSDDRLSRIDMPGDLDSYRVELEAGASYTIEAVGAGEYPLADPFLSILDANGERVASDDDSGDGLDARVTFSSESGGSHLIQVSGLGGSTGWYQVKIARR